MWKTKQNFLAKKNTLNHQIVISVKSLQTASRKVLDKCFLRGGQSTMTSEERALDLCSFLVFLFLDMLPI